MPLIMPYYLWSNYKYTNFEVLYSQSVVVDGGNAGPMQPFWQVSLNLQVLKQWTSLAQLHDDFPCTNH